MSSEKRPYVCPAEFAYSLDNVLRKLVHNPREILEPYIRKGMTVLDLGCGPGYFTAVLGELVGKEGRVIAADIQQKMLEKMTMKVRREGMEDRIEAHLCERNRIGITLKVDFILTFWMVHEVADQGSFFEELKTILNPGGRIWIIEPKIHVTGKAFLQMTNRLEAAGFEIKDRPKVALSRSVLISLRNH